MVRMKMSSLRRMIESEVRRSLREDANPAKINDKLYPKRLRAVKDPEVAKALATGGKDDGVVDDDTAGTGRTSAAANTLKASQTTMDFQKFVAMSILMLTRHGAFSSGPGGDLGAIVSSDGHIMDGHHRWAATLMVDPTADVGGIKVDIPGEKLVGVLNVWTVAKGQKGKPSTANMSDLTPDAVADKFKEMATSGISGMDSKAIAAGLSKNGFESIDAAAEHVKKNWESTSKNRAIKAWMPEKVDMPAIEPEQLAQVAKDITSGDMDINPPYSDKVKSLLKMSTKKEKSPPENAGRRISGDPLVERWQRLAGIIKLDLEKS